MRRLHSVLATRTTDTVSCTDTIIVHHQHVIKNLTTSTDIPKPRADSHKEASSTQKHSADTER